MKLDTAETARGYLRGAIEIDRLQWQQQAAGATAGLYAGEWRQPRRQDDGW